VKPVSVSRRTLLRGVTEYIILLFYYVSALTTREYCETEMSITLGQRIVVLYVGIFLHVCYICLMMVLIKTETGRNKYIVEYFEVYLCFYFSFSSVFFLTFIITKKVPEDG